MVNNLLINIDIKLFKKKDAEIILEQLKKIFQLLIEELGEEQKCI